jgi:hypothetical protein
MVLMIKDNLHIYSIHFRDLIKQLDTIVVLETNDLKANEFDRGFKSGQLELLQKIKQLLKIKEA